MPVEQVDRVPLKKTEIGLVPEHWGIEKLGDISSFKNGVNFRADQKGKGLLTIDVLNMYSDNEYVKLNNLYKVNITPPEEYLLREGDLLFVRSSLKQEGVGWPALFPGFSEHVTFCGFIIRARFHDTNINTHFLVEYLRLPEVRSKLVSKSGKVAITNINQGNLGSLIIPLPPVDEQTRIAEIASSLIRKTITETNRKIALERLFLTLLKNLMIGKV